MTDFATTIGMVLKQKNGPVASIAARCLRVSGH